MHGQRFAPAKVNLFLHVGPVGADGYHPVCSLMTFANVGDVVRLEPSDAMDFKVIGPYGEGLANEAGPNLVARARDAFLRLFDGETGSFRLVLDKQLPVAAGLGGGSADAAATLGLLCQAFGVDTAADEVIEIARGLGADVSACLSVQPVVGRGRGDDLDTPPPFPEVDAVLVNPNLASPTGLVYRAFDAMTSDPSADEPAWPGALATPGELAAFLGTCRNDLEAPAISLQSAISDVLAALRSRRETLIARMSGSGATCFAICASHEDARNAALAIADAHRDWWVRPCRLAGLRP
ncbi:MAG TPA: 4-(cytidine 5'-diphospho)-2-C-methyl-D-erythritol kinase [Caulobacteraceae bacterium]|nr:4-(cytidine 5'-diphospho)-2-C-methyl-D-erythritol kinase [Caulobacteraceae bacterium]